MTQRNQSLNDRADFIATEAIRQLDELLSVGQYVRAEEGDSASLERTCRYAHQLRSSINGIKQTYASPSRVTVRYADASVTVER